MVHVPVLDIAASGRPILILFFKLDDFQTSKLIISLLASKECHGCFGRVPGIVDAKKLPDKDAARFERRLEPGKDRGKLLFMHIWQREMGVDQIVAREGKILEG